MPGVRVTGQGHHQQVDQIRVQSDSLDWLLVVFFWFEDSEHLKNVEVDQENEERQIVRKATSGKVKNFDMVSLGEAVVLEGGDDQRDNAQEDRDHGHNRNELDSQLVVFVNERENQEAERYWPKAFGAVGEDGFVHKCPEEVSHHVIYAQKNGHRVEENVGNKEQGGCLSPFPPQHVNVIIIEVSDRVLDALVDHQIKYNCVDYNGVKER